MILGLFRLLKAAISSEQGEVYTGLIVDRRGSLEKPSMSPKIADEDGNEVYG